MSIYIAFGSNQALGDRTPVALLRDAALALEAKDIHIVSRSSLWHSPAWPDPAEPPYVNAVVEVETWMNPAELLARLHDVEAQFSRVRQARNAPRTLDLDILDFNGVVLDEEQGPVLPHPRAHQRAFVLLPLREISPGWCHPVSREGVDQLVARLSPSDVAATRRLAPFVPEQP